MQALLRDLQPAHLEDLVAALSLNRPAARASGMLERFLERRRSAREGDGSGTRVVSDDVLTSLSNATQGLILHAEQIMQIAIDMAGYTLDDAEDLHRVVSRRSWQELPAHRSKFLSGALECGVELPRAEKLFDDLVAVGSSVDSRAHNTGYALLTYWSAYLATHHRLEYTAAVLDSCVGQSERLERILAEAIDRHVAILDVDINQSDRQCRIKGEAIRLGLSHVRHIGESTAEHVVRERTERGAFRSLEDFEQRMVEMPHRTVESLVRAGAFESLHVGRDESTHASRPGRTRRATRPAAQLELDLGFGDVAASASTDEAEGKTSGGLNGTSEEDTEGTAKIHAEDFEAPGVEVETKSLSLFGRSPSDPSASAAAKRRVARRRPRAFRDAPPPHPDWVETPKSGARACAEASRLWVVGQIRSRA